MLSFFSLEFCVPFGLCEVLTLLYLWLVSICHFWYSPPNSDLEKVRNMIYSMASQISVCHFLITSMELYGSNLWYDLKHKYTSGSVTLESIMCCCSITFSTLYPLISHIQMLAWFYMPMNFSSFVFWKDGCLVPLFSSFQYFLVFWLLPCCFLYWIELWSLPSECYNADMTILVMVPLLVR